MRDLLSRQSFSEHELLVVAHGSDSDEAKSAVSKLVAAYEPKLKKSCRRAAIQFSLNKDRQECLLQATKVAFLYAIRKCDPARCIHNGTLGSYASNYIKKALIYWIDLHFGLQKLPVFRRRRRNPDQFEALDGVLESEADEALARVPIEFAKDKKDGGLLDPQEAVLAAEAEALVSTFVKGLSPQQQKAVQLVFFEELSQAQAAVEMGITRDAVGKLLQRVHGQGRRKLAVFSPAA